MQPIWRKYFVEKYLSFINKIFKFNTFLKDYCLQTIGTFAFFKLYKAFSRTVIWLPNFKYLFIVKNVNIYVYRDLWRHLKFVRMCRWLSAIIIFHRNYIRYPCVIYVITWFPNSKCFMSTKNINFHANISSSSELIVGDDYPLLKLCDSSMLFISMISFMHCSHYLFRSLVLSRSYSLRFRPLLTFLLRPLYISFLRFWQILRCARTVYKIWLYRSHCAHFDCIAYTAHTICTVYIVRTVCIVDVVKRTVKFTVSGERRQQRSWNTRARSSV